MLLSPLFECSGNYVRLVLYPAMHGKARPDITHIWPGVIDIRPDVYSVTFCNTVKRREEKGDNLSALRPCLSGTSQEGCLMSRGGLVLKDARFLFLSFCFFCLCLVSLFLCF